MTAQFRRATALTAIAVTATLMGGPAVAGEPDPVGGTPPPVATEAPAPEAADPTADTTPSPDHTVDPRALSAEATVDVDRRTVLLVGRSTPRATVVVDDLFEVEADGTGAWRADVTGVRLGPTTITLAEYVAETLVDESTLDVFVGQRLQASGRFPDDRTRRAQVVGTATPHARVEVVDAVNHVVGATDAADDGAFEADVLAPDAGGPATYDVRQSLDGEGIDHAPVTLDYGRAVEVTQPVDGAPHPAGPVALVGVGVPRGEVRVREKGSTTWLAPAATVLASGTWRLATTPLDDAVHELEVVQLGRGGNRTTDTVTVNDAEAPEPPTLLPGTITGPTTYVSGRPTTITGRATPGATVALTNAWQTPIVQGIPTDPVTGAWHYTRILVAPSVYTLYVTQQLGDLSATSGPFVITPETARPAFAVTSPDRAAGFTSGRTVTFAGTGDPRGSVRMQNKWGTPITGPVRVSSTGRWALSHPLYAPSTYYLTFIEATPGQPERRVDFGAFAPRP